MINYIIHLSDIHIRSGSYIKSRYEQYLYTFNNLLEEIKNQNIPFEECICVITGDIFHFKNNADSTGIQLFNYLIDGIAKYYRIYLIQGNHDFKQDCPEEPDILSSLFFKNPRENVFYLNKTDIYNIDNLVIGVITINDTLLIGSTVGINSKNLLSIMPKPNTNKLKICLFHGTIHEEFGYSISNFADYDLCLFGDIHLRNIYNIDYTNNSFYYKNKPWGYAGSLIQQSYGENILDHGFLLWNLKDKLVKEINVKTNVGYLNIYYNEQWLIKNSANENLALETLLSMDLCPKILKIRVLSKLDDELYNNLIMLTNKNPNIIIEKGLTLYKKNINDDPNIILTNDIMDNTAQNWINYIKTNIKYDNTEWESWILNPASLILDKINNDSIDEKIDQRNKKISNLSSQLVSYINNINEKKEFNIIYLSWSWLFCYKNNNYIDLEYDLNKNLIYNINGNNSAGKTSIFDIICLALFGKQIPSRQDKSLQSIINFQIPKSEIAQSEIRFIIGTDIYSIKRKYLLISDIFKMEAELLCNNSNLKIGSNAINIWLNENIGSLDQFLLSTMLTQKGDKDFLNMTNKSQIELLDKALNIDSITLFKNLLNEVINSYDFILKLLDVYYNTIMKQDMELKSEYQGELLVLNEKIEKYKRKQKECEELLGTLKINLYNKDYLLTEEELEMKISKLSENYDEELLTYEEIYKNKYYKYGEFSKYIISDVSTKIINLDLNITININNISFNNISKIIEAPKYLNDTKYTAIELQNKINKYQYFLKNNNNFIDNSSDMFKEDIYSKIWNIEAAIADIADYGSINKLIINNRKPSLTKEELNKFLANLEKMEQIILPNLETYNNIKDQILEKTKQLKFYNSELNQIIESSKNLAFNPQCIACNKQPWKLNETKYKKIINDLKNELEDLKIQYTTIMNNTNNNLDNLIISYNNDIKLKEKYKNELIHWTEYENYLIKTKYDNYTINLKKYENIYLQLLNTKKYMKYKNLLDKYNKIITTYNNEKIINDYTELSIISNNIIFLKSKLTLINKIKETQYYKNILNTKKYINKYNSINKKLDYYKAEYNKINLEHNYNSKINKTIINKQKESGDLYISIKKMTNNLEILNSINICFNNYRTYLYNDIIIPKICFNVNKLLYDVLDSDCLLKLEIQNGEFYWYIIENMTCSLIKVAGGFREFIFGLAIRIVLNFIGCSNVKCRNLFLDEGFVSGSAENLQKIPDFLYSLRSNYGYKNIFIVSHLDIIKNCSDIQIMVHKNNALLSHVQYGKTKDIIIQQKIIDNVLQCKGIKKNGQQCNYMAKINGYCKIHTN